jgi:hypothetical protein
MGPKIISSYSTGCPKADASDFQLRVNSGKSGVITPTSGYRAVEPALSAIFCRPAT